MNDEWEKSGQNCTRPVKSVRLKKESQLDRIERKLDELLKRKPETQVVFHSYPIDKEWKGPAPTNPPPVDPCPYEKAPW